MEEDRIKWNQKHKDRAGSSAPSPLVQEYFLLSPGRRALDIACGNGRNAYFLADNGFLVDAIDISDVAVSRILHQNINTMCTDLDLWTPAETTYDLIMNIRFLDRRIFPWIIKGLKPNGLLIFESFTGKDDDPYCLKTNELLEAFSQLHILYYKEQANTPGGHFKKKVSLVAVKE